jgi:hypothetical protein
MKHPVCRKVLRFLRAARTTLIVGPEFLAAEGFALFFRTTASARSNRAVGAGVTRAVILA